MKVDSSYCQRVTKDVVCSVVVSEDVGFTMCGEIINGDIEESSIAPTFYQSSEFKKLDENVQNEIVKLAFEEFKRFR